MHPMLLTLAGDPIRGNRIKFSQLHPQMKARIRREYSRHCQLHGEPSPEQMGVVIDNIIKGIAKAGIAIGKAVGKGVRAKKDREKAAKEVKAAQIRAEQARILKGKKTMIIAIAGIGVLAIGTLIIASR